MNQLSLIETSYLLKKTRIFSSLELDILLPIAEKMIYTEIPASEVIFDIGEQAYNLYLIVAGNVAVKTDDKSVIANIKIGEVFGDEAIFSGKTREYCVFTNSTVKLLSLSRPDLLAIIHEYPTVATGFLEIYALANSFRPRPNL